MGTFAIQYVSDKDKNRIFAVSVETFPEDKLENLLDEWAFESVENIPLAAIYEIWNKILLNNYVQYRKFLYRGFQLDLIHFKIRGGTASVFMGPGSWKPEDIPALIESSETEMVRQVDVQSAA